MLAIQSICLEKQSFITGVKRSAVSIWSHTRRKTMFLCLFSPSACLQILFLTRRSRWSFKCFATFQKTSPNKCRWQQRFIWTQFIMNYFKFSVYVTMSVDCFNLLKHKILSVSCCHILKYGDWLHYIHTVNAGLILVQCVWWKWRNLKMSLDCFHMSGHVAPATK